jgi:IstB-like ATP binding protein
MERSQLFDLMGELKLYGMKAAFDEIMATAVKRQHEPQRLIGDLLNAEITEKQARSIKYQLSIAKLPLAKDLNDFQFEGTPINETLVNELAGSGFIAQHRNAVLVGGTGTGKTHLAIAIARCCIRSGARGRFYNVVDLVNRLETEARNARQGRLADHLTRMDFVPPSALLHRVSSKFLPDCEPASAAWRSCSLARPRHLNGRSKGRQDDGEVVFPIIARLFSLDNIAAVLAARVMGKSVIVSSPDWRWQVPARGSRRG